MGWKQEAKEVKRAKYGSYCNMCRKLDIVIIPYHSFNLEIYYEIRLKLKSKNE